MKAWARFAWLFLLSLTIASQASAQEAFYLKSGDRVLFYGDSITEQNPYASYTSFVESYIVTRFPRLRIDFTNAGWAGDMVGWGPGGTVDDMPASGLTRPPGREYIPAPGWRA